MKIKISAGAERDIAAGCDFYKEIDPSVAMYFADSIAADIDSLILYAGVHAKVDDWHYTFASRFPFVIWYGVKGDLVIVYAVLDGRRDPTHNESALRNRRQEDD
ncbi:MAG: type II toxin-antitoxin system RelE/ParE family toxin [Pirellulales bacterium]